MERVKLMSDLKDHEMIVNSRNREIDELIK